MPDRPWTPHRDELRRAAPADWWVFEPGTKVYCPVCTSFLARYGLGFRVFVRRHPLGQKGGPVPPATELNGESRPCGSCGQPIELRLEVVDGSARVA
jgi:hypothetical protein